MIKAATLLSGLILTAFSGIGLAQAKRGATMPWTTYEAESMSTTGTVLGPKYLPYLVETESSGQRCVKLAAKGQSVTFTPTANANSMVIRFSLPDSKDGNGLTTTLGLYQNGKLIGSEHISSHCTHLYGKYPFTNSPADGVPRNFYDEIRIKDLDIKKGDIIQIKWDDRASDSAGYCVIDLVDLENIAPALKAPANALAVTDKEFLSSDFAGDYTSAFKNCITKAAQTGKTVWIPAGTYKITGDIDLPANVKLQGAGMWYTTLVGDESAYTNANKRVRLKGGGSNIHLSDFAIIGKLNYRSDKEDNDGIVGTYGENSTIANLWIEHTKVGMWIENSRNLNISNCRMRNTMADGINFCVGMAQSTITNCTARGTGDDCFALWPAVFAKQLYTPGHNLIINCTGQLPFLANGAAIYGGDSNQVKNCTFTDISQGSAILISTTFPTENKERGINNNFSGKTLVTDCDISTSGGFDHEWDWRGAVEICIDKREINGVEINNLSISNSLAYGLSVIGKTEGDKAGKLSNTILKNITITNHSIGVKGKPGLFIGADATGALSIQNSHMADSKNLAKQFLIKPSKAE